MQVNSDGLIMECNPASLEILGKHAKTGASLSSMLPDLAKIDLDKCILEEQLLTQESYIEDRCYNFVLRGISDLSLVYIYGSDITERKMAEEAFRENRKRLIKAEQVAHMGFIDWNLKTNEIILSRELYDLYGIDLRMPITVEQIVEMVHPDDIEFVNENLNLAIKGSREYNIDHRIVRLDDKVIWVHARADLELDKDGRPVSLIGTVIDITERKLAEQKLQESETSLVKAQEVAHIGSWDLDLLENKLIWTDENYRIFGVPKGTPLTYEKFLEIVHPEDRDYVDEKWHAAIKGEIYDIEHRLLIDNELKWVREKAELKFDDKGNPIGGIGITQDITERKLVEKEKQKLDKELNILSSKLLSTEELERKRIAGEIHDSIGQALSAIKFSVENSLIIIENGSIDSAIAALKKIVPLTQQTIEEVRNIVMALRPSTLDDLGLKATITWFCREFETVYTDIRVETEIYIEETDIPEQMKTVIFRIAQEAFNNAAKHSQSKHVYLSLEKIGDCLELVVEDKGCGFIVDEILAGTADKRGMGLASMRERALLSWGDIWIRSTPGVGTRIKVTWPMAAIFYKDE
jgi:PAS domain S-box-containing protein